MFCDFDSIFNPTQNQKIRQVEVALDAVRYCIQIKSCECCTHSMVIDAAFPSAPPEIICSLGVRSERTGTHCDGFCLSSSSLDNIFKLNQVIAELKENVE